MRVMILLCMVLYLGCGPETAEKDDPVQTEVSDFEDFYDRFHEDSAFQMAHIAFPLEGIPAHADQVEDLSSYRWQSETWVLHKKLPDSLTGYDRELTRFGEDIIIEKIVQRDTRIGLERRFARISDDWMLIYYADMNPLPED